MTQKRFRKLLMSWGQPRNVVNRIIADNQQPYAEAYAYRLQWFADIQSEITRMCDLVVGMLAMDLDRVLNESEDALVIPSDMGEGESCSDN